MSLNSEFQEENLNNQKEDELENIDQEISIIEEIKKDDPNMPIEQQFLSELNQIIQVNHNILK